jgi:hypothetical protein
VNLSVFLIAIQRAKSFLCYFAIASIYGASALVLPAKAEHCLLLPKDRDPRVMGGAMVGDFGPAARPYPVGFSPPARIIYDYAPSSRSILVPGCSPEDAATPSSIVFSNSTKSSSTARISKDTISPMLRVFQDYELTQDLIFASTDGSRADSPHADLPEELAPLYATKEVLRPPHQHMRNTLFDRPWTLGEVEPRFLPSSVEGFMNNEDYTVRYEVDNDWIAREVFSVTSSQGDSFTASRKVYLKTKRANLKRPAEIELHYAIHAKKLDNPQS